jgi:hypothetical protein
MPIYLIAAYAVFLSGISALALSIWARRRQLERESEKLMTRLKKTPDVSITSEAQGQR